MSEDPLDEVPIDLPPCEGLKLGEGSPCIRNADYRVPCIPMDGSTTTVKIKHLCGVHRWIAARRGTVKLQDGKTWERVWPPRKMR